MAKCTLRAHTTLGLFVAALSMPHCVGSSGDGGARRVGRPSWRVEKLELSPEEDPQQLHQYAVSSKVNIEPVRTSGAKAQWRHDQGLVIESTGPEAYVDLGAPFTLSDPENPDLLMEISAERGHSIALQWTDEKCTAFGVDCSRPIILRPGTRQVVRVPVGNLRSGHVETLRLRFAQPTQMTVHNMRAAKRTVTTGLILSEPENPTPPAASHRSQIEPLPGRGLRVIPTAAGRSPPGVQLDYRTAFEADERPVFSLEALPSTVRSVRVFWAGEGCRPRGFSRECRLTAEPSARDGQWIAQLDAHPRWRGRIDRFRIQLAGIERDTNIARMVFGTDGKSRSVRRRTFPEGGRASVIPLRAGERVIFELPGEDTAPDLVLDEVEIRLPPSKGYIRLFELSGDWRYPDGETRGAVYYADTFSRKTSSEWIRLDLSHPGGRPSKLVLELTCGPNCDRFDEPGRFVELDLPLFEYRDQSYSSPMKNLLVVMIDTLRADHLDVYGHGRMTSPFLAEFATRSTVYESVYSVDTWTSPGHAALFTGRYPYYAGNKHFLDVDVEGRTLAEALANEGYRTVALTDGGLLAHGRGLDRGFDLYDVDYQPIHLRLQGALELIRGAHERGRPLFTFVHSYAVHQPYLIGRRSAERIEPEFLAALGLPVSSRGLHRLSRAIGDHAHSDRYGRYLVGRYDAGIRAFDDELKSFLTQLETEGVLENTVVAIMSDHGEEFLEHGGVGHGHQFPYPELTRIPLIVRDPDAAGGVRVARPTSQVEIADILLQRLGFDGLSPDDPCHRPGFPASFVTTKYYKEHPTSDYFSVIVSGAACKQLEVSERRTGAVVVSELLDDTAGSCQSDLPQIQQVMACMKEQMRRHGAYGPSPGGQTSEASANELDAAQREQLEALGYLTE